MPFIIVDRPTRDVLVLNPQRNVRGELVLPAGRDAYVVNISEWAAAKFVGGGRFRLGEDGASIVVLPAPPPDAGEVAALSDHQEATEALALLQAYVDLASPTAAQTTAAVKLLCRVAMILIRRALRA